MYAHILVLFYVFEPPRLVFGVFMMMYVYVSVREHDSDRTVLFIELSFREYGKGHCFKSCIPFRTNWAMDLVLKYICNNFVKRGNR